jgi:hypothetical protein
MKVKRSASFLILLFPFTIWSACLHGQKLELRGTIVDGLHKTPTSFATISLFRRVDSIRLRSAQADSNGFFVMKDLTPGRFLMEITHIQFNTKWIPLELAPDSNVIMGTIEMVSRTSSLEEVIIRQQHPQMFQKGDTLEFNAAYVRVHPNATVEDLLKRLPGVQIDQNGNIIVNGEKVNQVLIDGEAFFSEDPTIATRNLTAALIDKIQVYDKKSPQAQLTGIDDGKTTRTLNLTIRNDRKKGYSGKVEAGSNAGTLYDGQIVTSAFHDKRQFSFFAMTSNTGQYSLTPSDGQTFDAEDLPSLPLPAGNTIFNEFNAPGGIPQTINTGVHYSNKWGPGNTRHHLDGNYRYNSQINNAFSNTITEQILPDSIYTSTQQTIAFRNEQQNTITLLHEFTPDSTSSAQISIAGLVNADHSRNTFIDTIRINNALINSTNRNTEDHISDKTFGGSILWRKTFVRSGSGLLLYAGIKSIADALSGSLYSLSKYFPSQGLLPKNDSIDEKKKANDKSQAIEGSVLFTLPLHRNWILTTGYTITSEEDQSSNSTWDKTGALYNKLVDSLTSKYGISAYSHKLSITLQKKSASLDYTVGADLTYAINKQEDLLHDTSFRRHFLNFLPYFVCRIKLTPHKYISINYFGTSQQPSISQLQPLKDNTDPLNITTGNPNLRPTYTHNIRLNILKTSPIFDKSTSLTLSMGIISNSISSLSQIDNAGRTTVQPINVNGNHNIILTSASSWKLQRLNLALTMNTSIGYFRTVNFVNGFKTLNDNYTPSLGITVSKFRQDDYSFSVTITSGFTYSISSINAATPVHYWTQDCLADFNYYPFRNFNLNTQASFTWRQNIQASAISNQNLLWNAALNKSFANNILTAKLSVFDILNQNRALSSTAYANQILQSSTNSLHRFFMMSISWNFTNNRDLRHIQQDN